MTLEREIKDLIRDIEKLKEVGTQSEILDELFGFFESFSIADSLSRDTNQKSFPEALAIADSLQNTPQDSGTFLVGTAKVGFADCA